MTEQQPMAGTVEVFLARAAPWHDEVARLRDILCSSGLEEGMKWGSPCYMHAGCNVVGIGSLKSYFGLWFFQGVLLGDPAGVLVNAQRGRTRAMRQWRMQSAGDIDPERILSYVDEASRLAASGRRIAPRKARPLDMPADLADALATDEAARRGFDGLTPGRQREFAAFIASAKRADTRARRLKKALPVIRRGDGLNDLYRR